MACLIDHLYVDSFLRYIHSVLSAGVLSTSKMIGPSKLIVNVRSSGCTFLTRWILPPPRRTQRSRSSYAPGFLLRFVQERGNSSQVATDTDRRVPSRYVVGLL